MPDYPSTALDGYEKRTSKGQPNGYAGLGPDGTIPAAQSPDSSGVTPSGAAVGVLGGSFPNPSLAAVLLAIPQAFGAGQSASAATIATGSTISTSGVGVARVAPSSIATGVVLQPGSASNPWLIVSNEAANTLTFAAAGTSHVANGVACQIKGSGALLFVWDSTTALWYPVGGGASAGVTAGFRDAAIRFALRLSNTSPRDVPVRFGVTGPPWILGNPARGLLGSMTFLANGAGRLRDSAIRFGLITAQPWLLGDATYSLLGTTTVLSLLATRVRNTAIRFRVQVVGGASDFGVSTFGSSSFGQTSLTGLVRDTATRFGLSTGQPWLLGDATYSLLGSTTVLAQLTTRFRDTALRFGVQVLGSGLDQAGGFGANAFGVPYFGQAVLATGVGLRNTAVRFGVQVASSALDQAGGFGANAFGAPYFGQAVLTKSAGFFRDAATRFRLSTGQPWLLGDATYSLLGTTTVLSLLATRVRNTAIRFRVQVVGGASDFGVSAFGSSSFGQSGGGVLSDPGNLTYTATGGVLSDPSSLTYTATGIGASYRHVATRLGLRAANIRDAALRFRVQAAGAVLSDPSSLIYTATSAVAAYRTTATRLRLRAATNRDTAIRFRVQVAGAVLGDPDSLTYTATNTPWTLDDAAHDALGTTTYLG